MDELEPPKQGMSEQLRKDQAEVMLRNKDCLVAQFFKRYPSADPRNLCLISRSLGDGIVVFYIEYRSMVRQLKSEVSDEIKSPVKKQRRGKAKKKAGDGKGKRRSVRATSMRSAKQVGNRGGA